MMKAHPHAQLSSCNQNSLVLLDVETTVQWVEARFLS